MRILPLLLLAFVPGIAEAKIHTLDQVVKLIDSESPGASSSTRRGAFTHEAVKVLLDNNFDYAPWMPEKAARIKTEFGLRAFGLLARQYNDLNADILHHAANVDNHYALAALRALAERYGTLFTWQVRWASEVHTQRELIAYQSAVLKHHNEKAEAEAALLDGLKSEQHLEVERAELRRMRAAFRRSLSSVVGELPGACQTRLNGAEIVLRDAVEKGRPGSRLYRWESRRGPDRLFVYWRNFYDFHGANRKKLKASMSKRLGCSVTAAAARAPLDPREAPNAKKKRRGGLKKLSTAGKESDLRDSLAPALPGKRLRLKPYKPPVIVVEKEKSRSLRLINDEMLVNENGPSSAKVVAGAAPAAAPASAAAADDDE